MKEVSPRHVLIGIAHYLPKDRRWFRDDSKLHAFFYRQKMKYGDKRRIGFRLLRNFLFDTNGTYPVCEELTQALASFILSGLLIPRGATSLDYQFSQAFKEAFGGLKLTIGQKKELEQLAQEFDRELTMS